VLHGVQQQPAVEEGEGNKKCEIITPNLPDLPGQMTLF
jgi:hypothetical protein